MPTLKLDALPSELLSEILCTLSANDIVTAEGTCHRWRICVKSLSDSEFWQVHCDQLSPLIAPLKQLRSTPTSWRALYVQHLTSRRTKQILHVPASSDFTVGFVLRASGGVYSSVAELATDIDAEEVAQGYCRVPRDLTKRKGDEETFEVFLMRKADGKILNLNSGDAPDRPHDHLFMWDLEGPGDRTCRLNFAFNGLEHDDEDDDDDDEGDDEVGSWELAAFGEMPDDSFNVRTLGELLQQVSSSANWI